MRGRYRNSLKMAVADQIQTDNTLDAIFREATWRNITDQSGYAKSTFPGCRDS